MPSLLLNKKGKEFVLVPQSTVDNKGYYKGNEVFTLTSRKTLSHESVTALGNLHVKVMAKVTTHNLEDYYKCTVVGKRKSYLINAVDLMSVTTFDYCSKSEPFKCKKGEEAQYLYRGDLETRVIESAQYYTQKNGSLAVMYLASNTILCHGCIYPLDKYLKEHTRSNGTLDSIKIIQGVEITPKIKITI